MKLFKNIALLVLISITLLNCKVIKENPPRIVEDFNFDWQFFKTKEELPISSLQTIKDWESVKIPHDWSITTPYNQAYKVTDSLLTWVLLVTTKKILNLHQHLKEKAFL